MHAGNGYLLDQFLRDGANRRDDDYGGTARNRARLLREVTAAVISIWGSKRVGVRISPLSPTNGMTDSDPVATFTQAARDLQTLGIGYLHVIEPGVNGTLSAPASAQSPLLGSGFFRPIFPGAIIAAGGHTAETGAARIQHGQADLIAYGQLFIANPDLPTRFRLNAPLAQPQRATFYGGGAAGYTDYPALDTPTTQPWIGPTDSKRSPGKRRSLNSLRRAGHGQRSEERSRSYPAWCWGPLGQVAAVSIACDRSPCPSRVLRSRRSARKPARHCS